MSDWDEVGLALVGILRGVGKEVRESVVNEAVEEERYDDAADATLTHSFIDAWLSLAEIRLKERTREED